jgi:hypothetical protein
MPKKRKTAKSSKSRRKPKTPAKRSERAALSIATSERKNVKERMAALAEASLTASENEDSLQAVLKILHNKDEPTELRLAALKTLQAASFGAAAFESCRGDYIAGLREVAEDPDPAIRQRVLGILAREKDGFAQQKLLAGLETPEKALVPPEKALQLLSNDVHGQAYQVARSIVRNPPNATARREALRLLAADAAAAPMFEKLLRDKNELAEIRQISASALQTLKPEKLQEHAREMLLDQSEYDEIRATSLSALTQFGDAEAVSRDKALLRRVDRLHGEGSAKVKQGARRFLDKYRAKGGR